MHSTTYLFFIEVANSHIFNSLAWKRRRSAANSVVVGCAYRSAGLRFSVEEEREHVGLVYLTQSRSSVSVQSLANHLILACRTSEILKNGMKALGSTPHKCDSQ